MTPSPLTEVLRALIRSFGERAVKRAFADLEAAKREREEETQAAKVPRPTDAARRRVAKKLAGMGRG